MTPHDVRSWLCNASVESTLGTSPLYRLFIPRTFPGVTETPSCLGSHAFPPWSIVWALSQKGPVCILVVSYDRELSHYRGRWARCRLQRAVRVLTVLASRRWRPLWQTHAAAACGRFVSSFHGRACSRSLTRALQQCTGGLVFRTDPISLSLRHSSSNAPCHPVLSGPSPSATEAAGKLILELSCAAMLPAAKRSWMPGCWR